MNKIFLIGRVGKYPEVRTVGENKVASFTLATNRKTKEKTTDWHRCQAWGKTADIIEKYVKKGSQIAIEGEVNYREYEKDGKKNYITDINVREVELLGTKSEGVQPEEQSTAKNINDCSEFESETSDMPF